MYTNNSNNMTNTQIIKEIENIIEGIEGDRFTIENLRALQAKLRKTS